MVIAIIVVGELDLLDRAHRDTGHLDLVAGDELRGVLEIGGDRVIVSAAQENDGDEHYRHH